MLFIHLDCFSVRCLSSLQCYGTSLVMLGVQNILLKNQQQCLFGHCRMWTWTVAAYTSVTAQKCCVCVCILYKTKVGEEKWTFQHKSLYCLVSLYQGPPTKWRHEHAHASEEQVACSAEDRAGSGRCSWKTLSMANIDTCFNPLIVRLSVTNICCKTFCYGVRFLHVRTAQRDADSFLRSPVIGQSRHGPDHYS